MQHLICKHEVHNSLLVHIRAEVFVVTAAEASADAVVVVKHGGHTIKAETVEAVFLHPEAKVGEQESQNFVVTVVKQSAVPELVATLGALVEVEVVGVVEHVQPVKDILRCVRVNHVEQDSDTHAVRSVNQLLELVRRAVAAAGSKEAVDLVAERSVVCMLHDSHKLNDIVAQVLDTREHILRELLVRRNLWFRAGNANVRLVDPGTLRLWRAWVLPLVLCGRVPETGVVDRAHVQVLGHPLDPSWKPLCSGMVVGNNHADLEFAVVLNRRLTVNRREDNLENTVVIFLHLMAIPVPAVEVADEVCAESIGSPLSVCDCVVGSDGEAKSLISA